MNRINKKFLIIFIILAICFGLGFFVSYFNKNINNISTNKKLELLVGDDILNIDIASTLADQAKGLGGKEKLSDDYGMLFVFPDFRYRSFWMKDMLVDIDIIWIKTNQNSNNAVIVGYIDNVPAQPELVLDQLSVYRSPVPVDKVLEVRAGLRALNNWDVDTIVELR